MTRSVGSKTWAGVTEQLVRSLETSAICGMGYGLNDVGCKNLANLLKEMAQKLDLAVERNLADRPDHD